MAPNQPLADPRPRTPWLPRIGLAAMTVARLLLGAAMLPYAFNKILDFQFQVSAWNYARPLGAVSGKALTWAMMGYSPHLQIFLGFSELVPALLLFSSRTRRLGALLMFPVLFNVVLINFSLDLWPSTQLISSVLLALNVFLLLYDLPLYLDLLRRLLPPLTPILNPRLRLTANILGFLIPTAAIAYWSFETHHVTQTVAVPIVDFIGIRQINRAGTFTIESFRIANQPVPLPPGASLYFDFSNSVVFGDVQHPTFGKFSADHNLHTFQIDKLLFAGSASTINGTYQVAGDRLLLNGTRDNQPIALVLEQNNWGRLL
jgi:hypothetical protein